MYFGVEENDHERQKVRAKEAVGRRDKVDYAKIADVMVISDWYRKALDIPRNDSIDNLEVCKPWISHWADLRAACQHPEPGVRVSTRVAILGTWLGLTGFIAAVAELDLVKKWLEQFVSPPLAAVVFAAAFGIACFVAGKGVKLHH